MITIAISATLIMTDGQKWLVERDMQEKACVELAKTFVEAATVGQKGRVRVNWACMSDDGKWLTPQLFSEIDGEKSQ